MTAEALQCPNCKLYNPSGTRRCDCGWEFGKAATEQSIPFAPQQLNGIRGWLLFPAAALLVSSVRYLAAIGSFMPAAASSSEVRSFFLFETVVSAALLAYLLVVAVAFFGKKRRAPLLFMILLAAQPVLTFSEILVMRQYPSLWKLDGVQTEAVRSMIAAMTAAAIWIPYFIQSKRVDATFTR